MKRAWWVYLGRLVVGLVVLGPVVLIGWYLWKGKAEKDGTKRRPEGEGSGEDLATRLVNNVRDVVADIVQIVRRGRR